MQWFLVVPGALVPAELAQTIAGAGPAAALRARLGGAGAGFEASDRLDGAAHWGWLAQAFGVAGDPPVTAPYAWAALRRGAPAPAGAGAIWSCDPVHFAFARDHLLLSAVDDPPLAADEARALQDDANEAAMAFGFSLELLGNRGFLTADRPLRLDTVPLDAALGASVEERQPSGPDSRDWRRLSNEIQMRWHVNPVNVARESRGAKAVNALWLHGGGAWQPLPSTGIDRVIGSDPVVSGWAQAAGAQRVDTPADLLAGPRGRGDAVSIYPRLFDAFAFGAWESWVDGLGALTEEIDASLDAAGKAGYRSLELVLCGRRRARRVAARPGSGFRARWPWRGASASALAGMLAEEALA